MTDKQEALEPEWLRGVLAEHFDPPGPHDVDWCDIFGTISRAMRPASPTPGDVVEAAARGIAISENGDDARFVEYLTDAEAALTASGLLDKNKALVEALTQAASCLGYHAKKWRESAARTGSLEEIVRADKADAAAVAAMAALKDMEA